MYLNASAIAEPTLNTLSRPDKAPINQELRRGAAEFLLPKGWPEDRAGQIIAPKREVSGKYVDAGDCARISNKVTSVRMRDHLVCPMLKLNLDLEAPAELIDGDKRTVQQSRQARFGHRKGHFRAIVVAAAAVLARIVVIGVMVGSVIASTSTAVIVIAVVMTAATAMIITATPAAAVVITATAMAGSTVAAAAASTAIIAAAASECQRRKMA